MIVDERAIFITSQHLTGILGAPQDPKQTLQQHMGQEQNYPQGQDIKILGWGREPGGYSYEDLPFRYPRTGNWILAQKRDIRKDEKDQEQECREDIQEKMVRFLAQKRDTRKEKYFEVFHKENLFNIDRNDV